MDRETRRRAANRCGRPPVYGIKIRKARPFALDFSNKPDVMFSWPAKGHRVKRGGGLMVKAVLVDPVHDFMIRGLTRTGPGKGENASNKTAGHGSLDPKVLITRADGEKVAQGVMPFG